MTTHTERPIHQHLAFELDKRLHLLRHAPKSILILGADGYLRSLLSARYPEAQLTEIDERLSWLKQSQDHYPAKRFAFFRPKVQQIKQSWQDRLPENSAQLLISNLTLSFCDELLPTFKQWAKALMENGLLFFTHFGENSLPEIRALLNKHNIQTHAPLLMDMHDLADVLNQDDFDDVIVDTAQITLTHKSSKTLLNDLHSIDFHRLLNIAPNDLARAQSIIQAAHYSGELTQISLETQFGHAIKKRAKSSPSDKTREQTIQFYR